MIQENSYVGLANQCLQPLSHPSFFCYSLYVFCICILFFSLRSIIFYFLISSFFVSVQLVLYFVVWMDSRWLVRILFFYEMLFILLCHSYLLSFLCFFHGFSSLLYLSSLISFFLLLSLYLFIFFYSFWFFFACSFLPFFLFFFFWFPFCFFSIYLSSFGLSSFPLGCSLAVNSLFFCML